MESHHHSPLLLGSVAESPGPFSVGLDRSPASVGRYCRNHDKAVEALMKQLFLQLGRGLLLIAVLILVLS
jgi:hypothetical protein